MKSLDPSKLAMPYHATPSTYNGHLQYKYRSYILNTAYRSYLIQLYPTLPIPEVFVIVHEFLKSQLLPPKVYMASKGVNNK